MDRDSYTCAHKNLAAPVDDPIQLLERDKKSMALDVTEAWMATYDSVQPE